MSIEREQRKYPRLSISDREYGVRFHAKDMDLHDSRLVNLSAGGCGLEIQIAEARHLDPGDILEALYLDHPDLPLVPLSAVVVRMLGKVPGKTTGYVLVGVEFQATTPFVRDLIADHVAAKLAKE